MKRSTLLFLPLAALVAWPWAARAATAHSITTGTASAPTGIAGSKSTRLTNHAPGDNAFLRGLTFDETGDKPCYVQAHWWRFTTKSRVDFTTTFDTCKGKAVGDKAVVFNSKDVLLPAVDSVKVCQSSAKNPRLKGATLTAAAIDRGGLVRVEPALLSRSFERPNCSEWSKAMVCPSGQAGTGIDIHHDNEVITGLALRCTQVVIGSPTATTAPALDNNARYENFAQDIQVQVDENGRSLTMSIKDALARHEVNAVSVVILSGGKVERIRHYGVKSRKTGEPADDDTLYQAASMSKLPAAIAMLAAARAERGPRLQRTVRESAREFPDGVLGRWVGKQFKGSIESGFPDDITVERLLSHSAGLDTHGIGTAKADGPTSMETILLGAIGNPGVKPLAAPGTKWDYSGGGYTAAEAMLEAHTGQSAQTFLTTNLLQPFGMTRSTYADATDDMRRLARGCSRGLCSDKPEHADVKFAGGLLVRPADYARMLQILLFDGRDPNNASSQLIPVPDLQRLMTPISHRDSSRLACSAHTACRASERCYSNRCIRPLDADGDWYGLGVILGKDADHEGYPRYLEHGGAQTNAYSKFKLDRKTRDGIVVFVAGESAWSKDKVSYGALALLSDILSSYARNY